MGKLLMKIKNSSPRKKLLYYSLMVVFTMVVISVITLSFYVGRVFYIKYYGLYLVPQKSRCTNIKLLQAK